MRLIDNCIKCDTTTDLYVLHDSQGVSYLCGPCYKEYTAEYKVFRKKFLKGDISMEEKEEKD